MTYILNVMGKFCGILPERSHQNPIHLESLYLHDPIAWIIQIKTTQSNLVPDSQDNSQTEILCSLPLKWD